jgi:hypothetical protein
VQDAPALVALRLAQAPDVLIGFVDQYQEISVRGATCGHGAIVVKFIH